MASGSRQRVAIIAEATRGTTPATPAFLTVRQTSCSLAMKRDTLKSEESRMDRNLTDVEGGARQVGGDIGFDLSFGGAFDTMLEALLGGTWTDDVLKNGTSRRYHTVERYYSDIASGGKPFHRFTGCEFNTLQLQVPANKVVTGSFGLVGKDMVLDTAIITGATYSTPPTTNPFASFRGSITEGGSTLGIVSEIKLNVDNGIEPLFVVGDNTSIVPDIKAFTVKGDLTVYFQSSAMLEKFINDTESSLSFDLTDKAGNTYTLTCPRIRYTGGQADTKGAGTIMLPMPFEALYSSSDGATMLIERDAAA